MNNILEEIKTKNNLEIAEYIKKYSYFEFLLKIKEILATENDLDAIKNDPELKEKFAYATHIATVLFQLSQPSEIDQRKKQLPSDFFPLLKSFYKKLSC
jgi:hypothetical protein